MPDQSEDAPAEEEECECGHPWGEHYDGWACMTCAEEGTTCPFTQDCLDEQENLAGMKRPGALDAFPFAD